MIDIPELMQQLTTLESRLHQMTQRAEAMRTALLFFAPFKGDDHEPPCWCDYAQQHDNGPSTGCIMARAALKETP